MKRPPDFKLYYGLFIISLATLTFELLISRVMSVVAWYHFAFMAICLALFGMTVGGVLVHVFKKSFLENSSRVLYLGSFIFSISLLLNMVIVCTRPVFVNLSRGGWMLEYQFLNVILVFVSIAVPLIGSGVCISLIFSQYAADANRVYFVNLLGAALGCLLFIPLINTFEVINSYFFLALLGIGAAILFCGDGLAQRKKFLFLFLGFLIAAAGINARTGAIQLLWAKGKPDQDSFYKKWNSFSYIRIMDWGKKEAPLGWGFSPTKMPQILNLRVRQIYLDIDAIAGTVMTDFKDRDLSKVEFLKYDITALPYYFVKDGRVLVIGIGAGRDIVTALLFNQKSITGVEINETILDVHRHVVPNFSGDLSRHPKVTFVHNEARSFINSSSSEFDLIQLSLIDTFAATQAGAYALTENNLYTIEAFQTYLKRLSGEGILSVAYWMHPGSPEAMLRLTAAATEALSRGGVVNPRAHLVIVHKDGREDGRGVANLLLKKSPFTQDELGRIQEYCGEMGFNLILSPMGADDEAFAKMSDPRTIKEFARAQPRNIAPASDDKPFFFLLTRLDLPKFFQQFRVFDFNAEYILFSLFLWMLVLTIVFVFVPLITGGTLSPVSGWGGGLFLVYFSAIGLAYMLVEMSQLTRLSSFLGHPIYSLSVVLFAFLLSSGFGSYFLGTIDTKRGILVCMVLFLGLCGASAVYTAPLLEYLSRFSILARILTAMAMVFPLGFFMGLFLPQGIRMLGAVSRPVTLFWGLNGAMSVLGSIMAMILQVSYGLSTTFAIGVFLYVLAAGALFFLKFNDR